MTYSRTVIILFVTLLFAGWSSAQLPAGAQQPAPQEYTDVNQAHWAADSIRRLSALGILTGYPDGTFAGQQAPTRYELAVVAARIVDVIGGALTELALDPAYWEDFERVANLLARVRNLEYALDSAASLEGVENLAERLANIEAHLNEQLGEERFPAPELRDFENTSVAQSTGIAPGDGGDDPAAPNGETAAGAGSGGSPVREGVDWWLGVAVGYPIPGTLFVGIEDLLPRFSLRAGLGIAQEQFGLELLAMYDFADDLASLQPYVAAGPVIYTGEGASASGITALGGLNIPLGVQLDERAFLMLEGGTTFALDDFHMNLNLRAGLGYRF